MLIEHTVFTVIITRTDFPIVLCNSSIKLLSGAVSVKLSIFFPDNFILIVVIQNGIQNFHLSYDNISLGQHST